MSGIEYLTTGEVAEILKVTDRAVRNWILSGRLEALRPFGRWRVTRQQLDAFMNSSSSVSPVEISVAVSPAVAPAFVPPVKPVQPSPLANRKKNRR